jgi:hypothetical protein
VEEGIVFEEKRRGSRDQTLLFEEKRRGSRDQMRVFEEKRRGSRDQTLLFEEKRRGFRDQTLVFEEKRLGFRDQTLVFEEKRLGFVNEGIVFVDDTVRHGNGGVGCPWRRAEVGEECSSRILFVFPRPRASAPPRSSSLRSGGDGFLAGRLPRGAGSEPTWYARGVKVRDARAYARRWELVAEHALPDYPLSLEKW